MYSEKLLNLLRLVFPMAYSIYLYMGGSLDETSQILKGNHSSLILQFEQEHICSYASKGTPNDFMQQYG